jgi:phosphotransferase system HPr (HPr) family protein
VGSEEIELRVSNEHGLHARPAALFVQTAARFQSDIRIRNLSKPGGRTVNAKSIMDLLTAGIDQGSKIQLTAEGEDASAALDALRHLIEVGLSQS